MVSSSLVVEREAAVGQTQQQLEQQQQQQQNDFISTSTTTTHISRLSEQMTTSKLHDDHDHEEDDDELPPFALGVEEAKEHGRGSNTLRPSAAVSAITPSPLSVSSTSVDKSFSSSASKPTNIDNEADPKTNDSNKTLFFGLNINQSKPTNTNTTPASKMSSPPGLMESSIMTEDGTFTSSHASGSTSSAASASASASASSMASPSASYVQGSSQRNEGGNTINNHSMSTHDVRRSSSHGSSMHQHRQDHSTPQSHPSMSSTYLMSSLHTIHSDAGDISLAPSLPSTTASSTSSSVLPSIHHSSLSYYATQSSTTSTSLSLNNHHYPRNANTNNNPSPLLNNQRRGVESSTASIGFSQLMDQADNATSFIVDNNNGDNRHQHSITSTSMPLSSSLPSSASKIMPSVPENRPVVDTSSSSTAQSSLNPRRETNRSGRNFSSTSTTTTTTASSMDHHHHLDTPLLASTTTIIPEGPPIDEYDDNTTRPTVTSLLSNNKTNANNRPPVMTPLDRAKSTVHVRVDNDECFDVSMSFVVDNGNNDNGRRPNTTSSNNNEICGPQPLVSSSSMISKFYPKQHPVITVDDIMHIIANPELLRLWYDPIEQLIVTSSSSSISNIGNGGASPSASTPQTIDDRGGNDNDGTATSNINSSSTPQTPAPPAREYDGEWIEATTTALESPPPNGFGMGYVYDASRSVLDTLGFPSYGRITMFVERSKGYVSLTVGPFNGGVHALHSIRVYRDDTIDSNGIRTCNIRVVDRVRLKRDVDGNSNGDVGLASFFGCGMFESCLSQCVLPSIDGYIEQVRTSMGRLRLLVESGAMINVDQTTSILVIHNK